MLRQRHNGGSAAPLAAGTSTWRFPGWGRAASVTLVSTATGELASVDEVATNVIDPQAEKEAKPRHASLGQFTATSIAGNDILSSCLYTAGACAQSAGKLAPVSLVFVGVMLYFFRYVYSEVVTAMPVNGGSYNALLNTTSKRFAAMAACLSLISYVATAVVSGCYAVIYIQRVWPALDLHVGTIAVLGFFALLTLIGVGESAVVATGMFFLHVATLLLLCGFAVAFAVQNGGQVLHDNWYNTDYPDVVTPSGTLVAHGSAAGALFFGYAAALLGITGFETAANYVEEMRDGTVYVATLRNMWWAAAVFNPVISLLAMAVVPMDAINPADPAQQSVSQFLLCEMASRAGGATLGPGLSAFVAVDAGIVLAGSVLTAYVGVIGLVRRLALDRCLPELFVAVNRLRGTSHWIIVGFFALTSSLFLLLYPPGGSTQQVDNLGSVYDLAFLSVMSAFAVSAMMLKWKRPDLPRLVICSYACVLTALACVLVGLVGNVIKGPEVLVSFVLYVGVVAALVLAMFSRTTVLTFAYYILRTLLSTRAARGKAASRADKIVEAHARTEARRLAAQHREMHHHHLAAHHPGDDGAYSASDTAGGGGGVRRLHSSAALLRAAEAAESESFLGAGDNEGGTSPLLRVSAVGGEDEELLLRLPALPAGRSGLLQLVAPAPEQPPPAAAGYLAAAPPQHSSSSSFVQMVTRGLSSLLVSSPVGSKRASVGLALVAATTSVRRQISLDGSGHDEEAPLAEGSAYQAAAEAEAAPTAAGQEAEDAEEAAPGSHRRRRGSAGSAGSRVSYYSYDSDEVDEQQPGSHRRHHHRGKSRRRSSAASSGDGGDGESMDAGLLASEHGSHASTALAVRPGSAQSSTGSLAHLVGAEEAEAEAAADAAATTVAAIATGIAAARRRQLGVGDGCFCNALGDVHRRRPAHKHAADAEASAAAAAGGAAPGGPTIAQRVSRWLSSSIAAIRGQAVVFFAKRADLVALNKAVLYVRDNELCARLVVVHVVDDRAAMRRVAAAARAAVLLQQRGASSSLSAASSHAVVPSSLFPALGAVARQGSSASSVSSSLLLAGGPEVQPQLLQHHQSPHLYRDAFEVAYYGPGDAHAHSEADGSGGTSVDGGALAATAELLAQLPPPPAEVSRLRDNVALMDAVYPRMRCDCLVVRGAAFGPPAVAFLARYLQVAPNLMFMAMPDPRFPHQFAALGGVRVITRTARRAERASAAEHLRAVVARMGRHDGAEPRHPHGHHGHRKLHRVGDADDASAQAAGGDAAATHAHAP